MIGLLAGGAIVTVWGQYVRGAAHLSSFWLMDYSLDTSYIVCSSLMWNWIRSTDNATNRHFDSTVGNLHGLDRARTWIRSECTAHSDPGCYENVSLLALVLPHTNVCGKHQR